MAFDGLQDYTVDVYSLVLRRFRGNYLYGIVRLLEYLYGNYFLPPRLAESAYISYNGIELPYTNHVVILRS